LTFTVKGKVYGENEFEREPRSLACGHGTQKAKTPKIPRAFSSEMETGSCRHNVIKQQYGLLSDSAGSTGALSKSLGLRNRAKGRA